MKLFKKWLGRPTWKPSVMEEVLETLDPSLKPAPPEGEDDAKLVAAVMLIFHDDRREIRGVYQIGEAFFLWTHDLYDNAKRVLPHGALGEDGPSFVKGWEPVTPLDWQPAGAETSHEIIARLHVEAVKLQAKIGRLNERLASHERLLRSISASAKAAAP